MPMQSSYSSMTPGVRFFIVRIMPLVFLGLAAWTGYKGVNEVTLARASDKWPTIPGKIIGSSVKESTERDNDGFERTSYGANVQYEFTVGGAIIHGTRVAFGDYSSEDRSHADELVARYPVGKEVTVRYQPSNPQECVLEAGVSGQVWFLPGFAGACVVIALFFATILPRWIDRARNPAT